MKPTTSASFSPSRRARLGSGASGLPNRFMSTPFGATMILSAEMTRATRSRRSQSQITATRSAQRAVAAGAGADRRVLPEGADLVDQGDSMPPGHRKRGERVQHRRMDMELVRPPRLDESVEPILQRLDLAPFA